MIVSDPSSESLRVDIEIVEPESTGIDLMCRASATNGNSDLRLRWLRDREVVTEWVRGPIYRHVISHVPNVTTRFTCQARSSSWRAEHTVILPDSLEDTEEYNG